MEDEKGKQKNFMLKNREVAQESLNYPASIDNPRHATRFMPSARILARLIPELTYHDSLLPIRLIPLPSGKNPPAPPLMTYQVFCYLARVSIRYQCKNHWLLFSSHSESRPTIIRLINGKEEDGKHTS